MKISMTVTISPDIKVVTRVWNRARKYALQSVGEYWVKHYLPGHFKQSAVRKYGYGRRKVYGGGKRRRRGDPRPLVATYRTLNMVRSGTVVRVRGAQAKVLLTVPLYIYANKRHDLVRELTEVTDKELETLAGVFSRSLMSRLMSRRTRRILGKASS